jgi:hypothetical protein
MNFLLMNERVAPELKRMMVGWEFMRSVPTSTSASFGISSAVV